MTGRLEMKRMKKQKQKDVGGKRDWFQVVDRALHSVYLAPFEISAS